LSINHDDFLNILEGMKFRITDSTSKVLFWVALAALITALTDAIFRFRFIFGPALNAIRIDHTDHNGSPNLPNH
jgi:hypothetical protein